MTYGGFRLQRLELYNWGTFHDRVTLYHLDGKNSLLTGDVGSGKSTIVDAMTTILIPAQRVQYNKAAGADSGERNLRSYVLGYYKSGRGEGAAVSKPLALRDHNSYSVILACFYHQGLKQWVSLAQVFWMKDLVGQPDRFYAVAERELSIVRDFSQFEGKIKRLKKRLKAQEVEVFESFPPYGAHFRRRLGIPHEQSLELFHQTVSMKTVGNLTDFVRDHMLEEFDVKSRIEALVRHYENLDQAHQAVVVARRQVEQLKPLVEECDRNGHLVEEVEEERECRDTLRAYFATLKTGLLEARLDKLRRDEEVLFEKLERQKERRSVLETDKNHLLVAIAQNGGDRIQQLEDQIDSKNAERERRKIRADRYEEYVLRLGLPLPVTSEEFLRQRDRLDGLLADEQAEEAELENERRELDFQFRSQRERYGALEAELTSLRSRRSNIDRAQVQIREDLCRGLGLKDEDLPFAGELLRVKDREKDWEGAIERLLRSFAMSLLVPEDLYGRVSEWVDATHLRGRLVYYKVVPTKLTAPGRFSSRSLIYKVEVKEDTRFYGWLERSLQERFDYACCEDLRSFQVEKRAITRRGQIKSPGGRHEKDDRSRVDDRSRFVLGWSNEQKIRALEEQQKTLGDECASIATRIEAINKRVEENRLRGNVLRSLGEYRDFRDQDWRPLVKEIAELAEELAQLRSSSDKLRSLQETLEQVNQALVATNTQLEDDTGEWRVNQQKQSDALELFLEAKSHPVSENERALFSRLEDLRTEILGEHRLTVESCDNRERDMREELQQRIDAKTKQIERSREKILRLMTAFRAEHSLVSQEMDAAVEAAPDYRALLGRLTEDDLPRFEETFKKLLNENTIREIANFQSQLYRERETIKGRVDQINNSLRGIDYNPGRYIILEHQKSSDPEVREFQADLRACTEGALTGTEDDQYSEAKFLKVQSIISRFKEREGYSTMDRNWTRKVTDVRQWFVFSASERRRSDESEFEHYADSGGKSGGQKEKLAYTILAASLSYQFGLEANNPQARKFHFVMIDEAFSKSDDETTAYGLELFQRLHLQLLMITPLQKIHIIESHVSSVGFVDRCEETGSRLQNLSIQEYQRQKELHTLAAR